VTAEVEKSVKKMEIGCSEVNVMITAILAVISEEM